MSGFDLRAFDRDRVSDQEIEGLMNRERNNMKNSNMNNNNTNRTNNNNNEEVLEARQNLDPSRLRNECIIAFKVYDSCRQQDCLEEDLIGPARAAEDICIDGQNICEGEVINPPNDAAAVTIDRLRIKKIIIVDKRPNELRRGFWNIDLKYVFEYRLTFRDASGQIILIVRANSIYNKQVILFGSVGTDMAIGTDLFDKYCGHQEALQAEPFVLVEAKAVALSARLRYQRQINDGREDLSPQPTSVIVSIGLFTIIKLFRIVDLSVQSRGFCIPQECEEINPLNPCEVFDGLDFPLDSFAPPQRPEFLAGISNNIPNDSGNNNCGCGHVRGCGCGCSSR